MPLNLRNCVVVCLLVMTIDGVKPSFCCFADLELKFGFKIEKFNLILIVSISINVETFSALERPILCQVEIHVTVSHIKKNIIKNCSIRLHF